MGNITFSNLISERGWTKGLIGKILGKEDISKRNPRYKNASPMKLYNLGRVIAAEQSELYLQEIEKIARKRESAQKANDIKLAKTIAIIDGANIKVRVLDRENVVTQACIHYNDKDRDNPDCECASKHSDPIFLNRICVNYLRHELTTYDDIIDSIKGHVGKDKAYALLKAKVLDVIAAAYPWLSDECESQQDRCTIESSSVIA